MQQEPGRTVIDGLFFYSDGHAEEALAGGIHAINLTVVHPLSGLTQAMDEIAAWTRRATETDSQWHLVRTTQDIVEAKAKPRPRNKSDKVIQAVAQTGGVIGLSTHGFMNWTSNPAQPPNLEGFVANVKRVRDLVGIRHIGIGTDHATVGDPTAADSFLAMSKEKFAGTAGDFVSAFGNKLENRYPKETPTPREYQRDRRHIGRSMIVGPNGMILGEASGEREQILFAELDLSECVAARLNFPWWRDRRPGLYQALSTLE